MTSTWFLNLKKQSRGIYIKQIENVGVFEGDYFGRVKNETGIEFFCFYHRKKILLYENTLTIAQAKQIKENKTFKDEI